jgi:flagellar basal body-associated protein FliL
VRGGETLSTLLWVIIIVLIVLLLTGGIGYGRRGR